MPAYNILTPSVMHYLALLMYFKDFLKIEEEIERERERAQNQ